MKKIAIPTLDKNGFKGKVADHFGRCLTYTFLNEDGKVLEIIENSSQHLGGTDLPPYLMKKHGADILLCLELGPSALNLCQKLGIEVYLGKAETVDELFIQWKEKKAMKASAGNVCKEHE
ncbi:dinitrogenase iron-molybdenum cofactor biosynthesis protein [Candidatus Microgenomates bacterium]|jgi:predicted Fe-Mo cluster-binding NifX family protein|nr:MAG: dinitrogenase iron-molybdenum cofactor biosynthesis protein [Candidatus Microgenomates bacterium]